MSASNPPGGRIAAENELLARLGLPPSATPEDVDQLHLAVSKFLAAAPSSIKGWAHAQAAMLDEAYLSLTDPVGLEGSALSSPTRPPTVVPGGPATPPARRDPVRDAGAGGRVADAAAASPAGPAVETVDDTDTDDIDALFASVTPGAHRDLVSGGKSDRASATRSRGKVGATAAKATPAAPVEARSGGPWKFVALGLVGLVAGALILFIGYTLGGSGTAPVNVAAASPSGPTVDMAKVASLMAKLQSNPQDTATMQAIGDAYFAGGDYATAGTFYDKVLGIDAKNVEALLARGAVSFNTGDPANALKDWTQVVSLDPKNQEAHYDLGFLYMSQASPDWSRVQSEWSTVISIDPTSSIAQTVQQHLTSLAQQSLIPAPSGSGASAAPSGVAAPSSTAAAPSAAASGAPSAAVTPSPAASGSAVP